MSGSQFDKPVTYKKGHVIFVEGEPSSFLYIVVSGSIRIFKEDKNVLIPVSHVGPKDFIGALSMFNDEPRSATAVAEENSEVLLLKKSDLRKVIKNCPDWVSNIMILISDRLRDTTNMLREHRISDEGEDITPLAPEDLKAYQKSIKDYRSRRGMN